MQQAKISFEENQLEFLNNYQKLGFKDKSSLVRCAVEEYKKILEKRKLIKSAELYAEIYNEDPDLKTLVNQSIADWPE